MKEFAQQPARVQALIEAALAIAAKNVTYTYGSADPAKGGVDCSGFIYFILRANGFPDVPRQANEQYIWLRKTGAFRAVLSRSQKSFELDELEPGDLLFWTGTYDVDRDPPITHSMIYLGTEKGRNARVMIGASDGRTYRGKRRWGVSVFDFNAGDIRRVETGRQPSFAGYASLPGLRD